MLAADARGGEMVVLPLNQMGWEARHLARRKEIWPDFLTEFPTLKTWLASSALVAQPVDKQFHHALHTIGPKVERRARRYATEAGDCQ
jgi:hypothetical protein